MRVQLEGITILSNDVSRLASFYREVLGFSIITDEGHYVEFENNGYVYRIYQEIVSKGATSITEPKLMDWGQTTGFFADPDGNIHSLFAINSIVEELA